MNANAPPGVRGGASDVCVMFMCSLPGLAGPDLKGEACRPSIAPPVGGRDERVG